MLQLQKKTTYHMRYRILLFSLLLCSAISAQMQVTGKVTNDASEPIEMATVRLLTTDSVLAQGAQTDMDGEFFLGNVAQGQYILIISSVGYKEHRQPLQVKTEPIKLRTIHLKEDIEALAEVEVKGKAAEMTVKGDTLEYNTAAYKTAENDMVEDLLKKMSGVEVDSEGNVKVNGEEIKGIRIDGKKFFGDDVQTATKNIPADMIEKIQVIDEKSDMAKLTGFEDDDSERIINLKLKEDKKKGAFGNFTGGLGADMIADNGKWFGYNKRFFSEDFRYNANAFVNLLSGESQTTVLANANNTNDSRSARGRDAMMGSNSGITWTENIGLNTNIAGKNGWTYGGDVQFNHSSNNTLQKSEKEQWSDDYTYNQNDTTARLSNTFDVKTQFEAEYNIDSLNSLIFKPEISYTNSHSDSYKAYDYLRAGDTTTVGVQNNNAQNDKIAAKMKVIYNHKFLRAGRTLTLNATVSVTDTRTASHNWAENYVYNSTTPTLTTINQWTRKTQDAINYEVKASYVEPIYKNNHFLETAITFSQNNRYSDKNQFNDSLLTVRDDEYSNSLKNLYFNESVELNYKWKEQLFDLTAGLKFNPSQTLSTTTYGDGTVLSRNRAVYNFSPNASFKYKFGKKQFARLQYRGKSSEPTIDQMEPVKDNSNAMNETLGNLSLVPQFGHTLRFMYSQFNETHFSSLMTGLRATITKDALVSNNIYDESGKRYQQTVNAQSTPYSIDADLMYNTPFFNKKFQFNTRTSIGYQQQLAYVAHEMKTADIEKLIADGTWMLGDESRTGNLQAREDLTLRFTHDIVDIGVRGTFAYSFTHNNLTTQSTSNVFNWSVTGDLTFHLPRSWEITTDIGYTDRIGYGQQLGNLSEIMWNASVSKTWTNATLSLKANDILNQRKNIVQTVGENYVQYQRFNTLPTYFMLSFTYKLNRMGNLKAKGRAAKMQEMLESGQPPMGNGAMPPPPMEPR